MWGEIIQLLVGLPVAAGLLSLIPRPVARAWAVWLLVCLIVVGIQAVGQEVFSRCNPEPLRLATKENDLDFIKNEAGDVAEVVVHNPWEGYQASRMREQSLAVASSSVLLAFAVLFLVLRAGPVESPPPTLATGLGRGAGISVLAFGLLVLLVSLAEAIVSRHGTVNMLGVVVIASGYYLGRGSLRAAKWALALTGMIGVLLLVFATIVAGGGNLDIMGREIQPGEGPWAVGGFLLVAAWAAVNVFLTARFLTRPDSLSGPGVVPEGEGSKA